MRRFAQTANGYAVKVGDRVELHPATDAWMSGDRFGVVERLGNDVAFVRMDRSGRVRRVSSANIGSIVGITS